MTRRTVWWAIPLLAIAISLFALPTLAQSQTTVTGAGAGVYPAGTTIKSSSLSALKGVTLTSLTFGMGVGLPGDGTANGTFESTLMGLLPNGEEFAVQGIDTFRLKDGKVVEIHASYDTLGQMQQLEVVPRI